MSNENPGEKKIDVFPQLPMAPVAPKLTAGLVITAALMFILSGIRIVTLMIVITTTPAPGLTGFGFFLNLFISLLCIYVGYQILKRRKSAFSSGIVILGLMIVFTVILILIAGLDLVNGDIVTLAGLGLAVVILILIIAQRKYFVMPDPKKGGFQKQPPTQQ
jgi:hypothetical protein